MVLISSFLVSLESYFSTSFLLPGKNFARKNVLVGTSLAAASSFLMSFCLVNSTKLADVLSSFLLSMKLLS